MAIGAACENKNVRRIAQAKKGGAVLPKAKKRRTEAVVHEAAFRKAVAGAGKRNTYDAMIRAAADKIGESFLKRNGKCPGCLKS
jgi:hypothetical protein